MEGFLLQLGSMSIQAVIVILVVLLVRVAFAGAKVPKKYVMWLWMVPYIIMICPWKINSVFSFWQMPKKYQVDRIQAGTETISQTMTQMVTGALSGGGISEHGDVAMSGEALLSEATGVIGNGNLANESGNGLIQNVANGSDLVTNTWGAAEILGLVWLLGVAILLIYSVVSYIKLQRKVICSMQVENNIYRADDISTAFVVGVIRPKIYLPSALQGENLTYVLEHEKTHIKRFDPLKKICAFGITGVHWFNPFAWIAFYFFCKDMEMACDEETVVRIGMEKKQEYAMALLQLSSAKKMIAGAPLAFGEDNVKDRVRNIAKFKKAWVIVSVVAVIVVIVLAAGFLSKNEDVETKEKITGGEQEPSVTQEPEFAGTPEGETAGALETPELTPEPAEESAVEWSQTYPWADLDGDGTEEYILIERGDFRGMNSVNGRLTVFVNNEPVYLYTEELWIVSVDAMEYLDLDGDGQEEIFVSFMPAVNSMPLEEWFVLKKVDDSWEMLEMYHYQEDMRDNAFPITVELEEKDFDFVIRCEGWDGEIAFDATEHYERRKAELEEGNDAYEAYMEGAYVKGSVVGNPLAWGIWNIQTGTYEDENCLIAEHGLGGPWGKYDYYGNAYVYFNYDESGKISILHMEFKPTDF